jgi:hypothetical protein
MPVSRIPEAGAFLFILLISSRRDLASFLNERQSVDPDGLMATAGK